MSPRPLIVALATGFGAGYTPKIPGTVGTLVGGLLYFGLSTYSTTLYVLITIGLLLVGVWLCDQAATIFNREDPPQVVWDEMIGYLIAMAAAPRGLAWAVAGFVLFRFFDIVKPGPVGWADRRLMRGWGIMMDDAIAGLLTLLILLAVEWGGISLHYFE